MLKTQHPSPNSWASWINWYLPARTLDWLDIPNDDTFLATGGSSAPLFLAIADCSVFQIS